MIKRINQPQAFTQTVTEKSIRWNTSHSNGGYIAYWKLYAQLLSMVSDKSKMKASIREQIAKAERVLGVELQRKVDRAFFRMKLSVYTWQFVWACLIKPLGQFCSRRVTIEGSYRIVNGQFQNRDLAKSTVYRVFGLPVWAATNQCFTEEEMQKFLQ